VGDLCGDGVTWNLTDGVLTISKTGEGTGAMTNYSRGGAPWYANRESITSIYLGDGVTSIGSFAFCQCAFLTSVTIPNSMTTIGAA